MQSHGDTASLGSFNVFDIYFFLNPMPAWFIKISPELSPQKKIHMGSIDGKKMIK